MSEDDMKFVLAVRWMLRKGYIDQFSPLVWHAAAVMAGI